MRVLWSLWSVSTLMWVASCVPAPAQISQPALPRFGACHYVDADLPDPTCTPGEIDPSITQDNLHSTICVSGWLDRNRPRPSSSVTDRIKYEMLVAYGQAHTLAEARTIARGYELDHFIPRELGGLSAVHVGSNGMPTNLYPEPGASPNPKDALEDRLHRDLCANKISLADAQQEIRNYHAPPH